MSDKTPKQQFLLTAQDQLIPLNNQEQQPQNQDFTYIQNQELNIKNPRPTDMGFIPHHNIKNDHPDLIAYLAKLTTPHDAAIKYMSHLIAGSQIQFILSSGKPASEQQTAAAHQYLNNIGYQYPNQKTTENQQRASLQNIHQQIARQLYTFGAVPFVIIAEPTQNQFKNTTSQINKIIIQPYQHFRFGLPMYNPKTYQFEIGYHLYNQPAKWHERAAKPTKEQPIPPPTNPKLDRNRIIDIAQYDPINNPNHTNLFRKYPIYNNNETSKYPISSYLLEAEKGNNIYYPQPTYETMQFLEEVNTPYHIGRFGHEAAKNSFKSQYIVNVYSEAYQKDPEDPIYQDQIAADASNIRKNMIQSGNTLIQPLPIISIQGEKYEGQVEIIPIPAPENNPENKEQTKQSAQQTILMAHGIAPELIGIQSKTNSLAAQDKYIWSRQQLTNQQVVEPYQKYLENFITILLQSNPALQDLSAQIIPLPDQQTIQLFKDYFTIDEVRQRLGESPTTPQQKQEILTANNKNKNQSTTS